MRDLLIFTRIMHLIFWICLGVLMVNCEEVETPNQITQPTPTPSPDPEEPVQELKVPAVVIRINRQVDPNLRISGLKEAVITIREEDGTLTEYEMKKIQVEEQEGYYLTEKIFLPKGSYEVVAFYILGEGNSVEEATPQKTSSLSDDPALSLPIPFEIVPVASDADEEPVTQLPMNVISVAGKSPKDFGFQSFDMQIKDPVSIYVALVTDARLMDFISGTLQIIAGEEIYDLELLEGINQTMILSKADAYIIKAERPYHVEYSHTYTFEELKQFIQYPLVIELEELECIPMDFLGDVTLSSQTEVINWAKKCYIGIRGNLLIQDANGSDPIVDLSLLEAVTNIYGDLVIDKTLKLKNLHGLHNLTTVEGWAKISDNSSLESLDGLSLPQDSHIHLTIEDNPSLLNLRGLENVYSLGYVDISSNASLVNFEGLNQLTTLYDLRVALNGAQTSFEGLGNLRNVGTFEIVGLNISNFDGLNRLESISSLLLYSSNKVSDFKSLPATVTSTLDIMGSSIRSLEGLKLTDQLINLFLRDNYELSNIRALSSLKKITRRFSIEGNSYLPSLAGLENLSLVGIEGNFGYKMEIRNNDYLADFCALTKLFTEGSYHEADIRWNGYNPTVDQIKEGECVSDLY